MAKTTKKAAARRAPDTRDDGGAPDYLAAVDDLERLNQELGAEIDRIRDQRRALNAAKARLLAQADLARVAENHPGVVDAHAAGATVVADAAEVMQAVQKAMADRKAREARGG